MSLLNSLLDDKEWQAFLEHKKASILSEREVKKYEKYIEDKEYEEIATHIINGDYKFSFPRRVEINKIRKNKKRIVYIYKREEIYILKMLAFLMYKYDYLFTPNLYSFRQRSGCKKAISDLIRHRMKVKYGYKVDISNYFNSIPVEKLLETLKEDLEDDKLYGLFYDLLINKKVLSYGEEIEDAKGIMAGMPLASFLANYYLKDLDKYFYDNKIIYCRYADDIIVFDEQEKLNEHRKYIISFLKEKGLEINSEKEFYYAPRDEIEFLGFSYKNGTIDLNKNSIRKIKGKIRRSARGLRRWMIEKETVPQAPLKAMNRKYNKKFYGKEDDDLSWKYWFFPTINTDKSLKIIDEYMQDWQRYIVTGVHNKKNYEKVPYKILKEAGYKSLVNEYYKYKKENLML